MRPESAKLLTDILDSVAQIEIYTRGKALASLSLRLLFFNET